MVNTISKFSEFLEKLIDFRLTKNCSDLCSFQLFIFEKITNERSAGDEKIFQLFAWTFILYIFVSDIICIWTKKKF